MDLLQMERICRNISKVESLISSYTIRIPCSLRVI